MKKSNSILIFISFLLALTAVSSAQIQGTWELLKSHEIYFKIDNKADTLLKDTIITEQPENAFYKYTADSLYSYDLDYEDSKARNCYLLWVSPYKLLDDTSFDIGSSGFPEVKISSTFHFSDDTLICTELWWEDWPDFIYHQSKILYFVKRDGAVLPPSWWPKTECHTSNSIKKPRVTNFVNSNHKGNPNYNLLGQFTEKNYNGLKVNKNVKKLELDDIRK